MAYKRRQRNAKIQKEKKIILRSVKIEYQWHPHIGQSFVEYTEQDQSLSELLQKAGYYAKKGFHAGRNSTALKACLEHQLLSE